MNDIAGSDKNKKGTFLEKIALKILAPTRSRDLLKFVNSAFKTGAIDPESRDMIKGVIEVAFLKVNDIMVPRTQMVTVHLQMNPQEIIENVVNSAHTRTPVLSEDRDHIIGVLHTKDLLRVTSEIKNNDDLKMENIRSALRPAIFVPESKKLDKQLRDFKSNHNHLAIVVDEYGVVAGLVTIEDILEKIVGNIEDEFDKTQTTISKISDNSYHVGALTEISSFNDYFKSEFEDNDYDTIGGLIIHRLERLPQKNEFINLGNFKFTVIEADKRHIITVQVDIENE